VALLVVSLGVEHLTAVGVEEMASWDSEINVCSKHIQYMRTFMLDYVSTEI
jgi:hypothetical protein